MNDERLGREEGCFAIWVSAKTLGSFILQIEEFYPEQDFFNSDAQKCENRVLYKQGDNRFRGGEPHGFISWNTDQNYQSFG